LEEEEIRIEVREEAREEAREEDTDPTGRKT
jgi:hypothetical protein